MPASIRYFYQHYVTRHDRIFLLLSCIGILLGISLISLNHFDFHYTTTKLFETHVQFNKTTRTACIFSFGFIFLFYGMYIREMSPRFSTFMWGLGLFFWCIVVNLILCNGLQSTPFTPIDPILVKVDTWFGINTPALMSWTHFHPHIHHGLEWVYDFLTIELFLVPFLLATFNARKALWIFFVAELLTFYFGGGIYYFFPTMAPSGIFHSPYFTTSQHNTSLRFYEVHHFLKIKSADGGLIAFPSFHVIWATLLTNACRGKKIFFYPMICMNILVISSTVLLGWHYFADVLSGLTIGILGIIAAEKLWKNRD